jgi:hypothetical protein
MTMQEDVARCGSGANEWLDFAHCKLVHSAFGNGMCGTSDGLRMATNVLLLPVSAFVMCNWMSLNVAMRFILVTTVYCYILAPQLGKIS